MASPPPFRPEPDLARLIGVPALGLLVWLISKAEPAPDVPGGWCVAQPVAELTRELSWGKSRFTSEMKSLRAAGLIEVDPGIRLGEGGGSTPHRYFLTYSPDLPGAPNGPTSGPGSRQTRYGNSRFGSVAPVDDVPGDNRHLSAVRSGNRGEQPVANATSDEPNVGMPPELATPATDAFKQQQDLRDVPKFALSALEAVGWVGAPPQVEPDMWPVVAAVAQHLAGNQTRWPRAAGMLSTLIARDALLAFAQREGVDPTGAVRAKTEVADSPAMMPFAEYTQACIDYPEWEAVITVETERRARHLGVPTTMALRRTVALEIPPGSVTASNADSG